MRTTRSTLRSVLREIAQAPVAAPSAVFSDRLEQQLRAVEAAGVTGAEGNVIAFRRRVSRGAAIGIIAGVMSAAGAAAVAIVTVRHADTPPATTTMTMTTQAPPTETTDAVRPAPPTLAVTIPSTPPPTSNAPAPTSTATSDLPTNVAAAATTTPPTAAPSTTPVPTELAPTSPPPPPAATTTATTEVQVSASLQLSCSPTGTAITCSWSAVPPGTDHVIVLRSTPSEARGRVLFPDAGASTITDGTAGAGTTYTYLVHAMDASDHSLAHSNPVTVACCG